MAGSRRKNSTLLVTSREFSAFCSADGGEA